MFPAVLSWLAVTAVPSVPGSRLPLQAIHPMQRATPSPPNGSTVAVNPPPLLWPVRDRRDVHAVRLSRDAGFPEAGTFGATGLRWAVYNPHHRLLPGTWYWQVGTVAKSGDDVAWADVLEFTVPASGRVAETSSAEVMLASCPSSHPRVLITAGELEAFRARAAGRPEAARILRDARRHVGKPLPDESSGKPKKKGNSAAQAKKFANWASKALGTKMGGSVEALCRGYLISGEGGFAEEAVRRALHVAGWDPNGVSRVNDFSDGACLRAMALAYDTCYERLGDEQRELLRAGITARAGRFFGRWRNSLEARPFHAHVWQHILHDFTYAAFATVGEIPEADAWASYVYEIWLARFPLMGGGDGGWANGTNYFGTNFKTLVSIPSFFRRLTGVDLFEHPWYQAVPGFMSTVWPPGSASIGFGDGSEKQRHGPSLGWLAFCDAVSRETGNARGAGYVGEALGGDFDRLQADRNLGWHRLRTGEGTPRPAPQGPDGLPRARAFRDIGVVAMHSRLDDTERNLMVGLRSSPYGSYNHAHANQNSFVVLLGGERLFFHTGYYIAYGDKHFSGWYKHTRGHNAVLIDGKGQAMGTTEGYGWIPRFLDGTRISACTGDASNAYAADAGLLGWRRHVVLLRPDKVVVYDVLDADHEARWDWLLHSDRELTVDAASQSLTGTARAGRGRVTLYASGPLDLSVDTRFDPPALNWRGSKDKQGEPVDYPDQWHATVTPRGRCGSVRFLTLIATDEGKGAAVDLPSRDENGIAFGDWMVRAELDPKAPAGLAVDHRDGLASLSVDAGPVTVAGKQYGTAGAPVSLLVEQTAGGTVVQQAVDELPVAARR